MSDAIRGALSEHRPTVIQPAEGIISVVHDDNTTIDMTWEQALEVGERLVQIASWHLHEQRLADSGNGN